MRFVLAFILGLLLAPASVWAAEFYFGSNDLSLGVGGRTEVGVLLSTQGQAIAAVEGEVTFPEEYFEVVDIRDGDSAINFWIEQPHVAGGTVRFAGVTPGGIVRQDALLFTLVLEAKAATPQAVLNTLHAQALLNDGQGTAASVTTGPLEIEILAVGNKGSYLPPVDNVPPEAFVLTLAQDPDVYNGAWSVVFATQDKGVGIDHYEVQERLPWWQFKGWGRQSAWVRAESPYLLQDQGLTSRIAVKALDKSGNERLSTLAPTHGFFINAEGKNWGILGPILLIMAISIIIAFGKLWRKRGGRFH
jgi:hypothetical protein